jgi:hypothetical protein
VPWRKDEQVSGTQGNEVAYRFGTTLLIEYRPEPGGPTCRSRGCCVLP